MQLIPWRKATNGLTNLRGEFDDLFGRMLRTFDEGTSRLPETFTSGIIPPVEVAETESELEVRVELPGLDEKDIQLEVMGDQLIVSGERKWKEEKKTREVHRVETQYGHFHRAIPLPPGLRNEAEAIKASYKKGVLEVHIPKVAPSPKAKIPVKAG
jgi:HSP20 family protein